MAESNNPEENLFKDDFQDSEDQLDFLDDFPEGGGGLEEEDEFETEENPNNDLNLEGEEEQEGEEEEEEEEDPNALSFDDNDDSDPKGEEFTDQDLKDFNKKLNTDFKTSEELKKFLNKGDSGEEEETLESVIDEAQKEIDLYTPYLEMDDLALMRSRLEAMALADKKDLNDDDVQFGIEEELNKMEDSRTLSLHAKNLRDSLTKNYINPAKEKKTQAETKKIEEVKALETQKKESIQNALVDIHRANSFFGLKPDQKTLQEAYSELKSGDFLERIQSDPKMQAELAVMYKLKDELSKKASGLSYSDGMSAILDEFKSKEEKTGLSRARKSGTRGSAKNSENDLLADILYSKPEKED